MMPDFMWNVLIVLGVMAFVIGTPIIANMVTTISESKR